MSDVLRKPALLSSAHSLTDFNSGVASLDDWLLKRALANQMAGASRVYVVTTTDERVVGYYALAFGALAHIEAPGKVRRNMPDPIPMAALGRLAIDRGMQGKGLGVALLRDAVLRVRQAADIVGIRGILVHAISEDDLRFYEHHGFVSSPSSSVTLVLSIAGPERD